MNAEESEPTNDPISDSKVDEPVNKSKMSDSKFQKKSIQELQNQTKLKKWQQLGFDQEINKSKLNKNLSLPNFNKTIETSKNKVYFSFSNLDSLVVNEDDKKSDALEKVVQPMVDLIINQPSDQTPSQEESSDIRSGNSNDSDDKSKSESNNYNDTFCTEINQDQMNQKIYINNTPNQKSRKSIKNESNEENPDVPPNLKPYVFHSKDSLTYKVLCGEKPTALSAESKASIISDLHKYIDIAADNGLIGEAYYIQSIIGELKEDNSVIKYNAEKSINDIDQKLNEAKAELEEQMKMFEQQKETYEQEKCAEEDSLNQRYQSAAQDLDTSWTSSRKQQMYAKPSSTLLNMRKMLQEMIKTKKFENIEKLGQEINAREKEEAQEAASKMRNDYEFADARLRDVYQIELLGINGKFETRMNNLARIKEKSLRPILQRIENLKKNREEAVLTSKKLLISSSNSRPTSSLSKSAPSTQTKQSSSTKIVPIAKVPAFVQNPKLNVPAFCPKRRDNLVASMPSSKVICRPKTKQTASRSSLSGRLYT